MPLPLLGPPSAGSGWLSPRPCDSFPAPLAPSSRAPGWQSGLRALGSPGSGSWLCSLPACPPCPLPSRARLPRGWGWGWPPAALRLPAAFSSEVRDSLFAMEEPLIAGPLEPHPRPGGALPLRAGLRRAAHGMSCGDPLKSRTAAHVTAQTKAAARGAPPGTVVVVVCVCVPPRVAAASSSSSSPGEPRPPPRRGPAQAGARRQGEAAPPPPRGCGRRRAALPQRGGQGPAAPGPAGRGTVRPAAHTPPAPGRREHRPRRRGRGRRPGGGGGVAGEAWPPEAPASPREGG